MFVGDGISVCNGNTTILSGRVDPSSKLYALTMYEPDEKTEPKICDPESECLSLARTYSTGARNLHSKSTQSDKLLWQLHLRHGHRNFKDLIRQYRLSTPSVLPTCSSCVMGKAHIHPHMTEGFERAKRRGEGFHVDFRGPFSVATQYGELYFCALLDDYSRRIFPYLVKTPDPFGVLMALRVDFDNTDRDRFFFFLFFFLTSFHSFVP